MMNQTNGVRTKRRIQAASAAGMLLLVGISAAFAQSTPTPAGPGAASVAAGESSSAKRWMSLVESFAGGKESAGKALAKVDPCRDVTMRYVFPAEVAEVLVKGGDRVKQGQVMSRVRDADIKAAIEQQRLAADSDLEVRGARASADLAKFRFEQLKTGGVFTPEDFERARADSLTTQVQYEQALLNRQVQKAGLDRLIGQFERYRLEAPFDGIVENVMIEVGRGVGEQVDAIRVVNIDNLWLDAYPDTEETLRLGLKSGSPAWVLLNLPEKPALIQGKVLYVSPAADYVGQTRRVRVEIPNPLEFPAGLQGAVRFTEPSSEWKQYLVKPAAGGGTMTSDAGGADRTGERTAESPGAPAKFAPPPRSPGKNTTDDRAQLGAARDERGGLAAAGRGGDQEATR